MPATPATAHPATASPTPVHTVTTEGENTQWALPNGERHRVDGPAVLTHGSDGDVSRAWHQHEKRHRAAGPAFVIWGRDGYQCFAWSTDGWEHRLDGPSTLTNEPGDVDVNSGIEWRLKGRVLVAVNEVCAPWVGR